MKTLQISEGKARSLYKTGSSEIKELLEENFGKDFFYQKITDRVKSYLDACTTLGEQPHGRENLLSKGFTLKEIYKRELETIARALNEGWIENIYNVEKRWIPYFVASGSPAGFQFGGSDYDSADAYAGSGSRLSVKSKALSDYYGTQFIELWRLYFEA